MMEEKKPASYMVWNIQEIMDVCTISELKLLDEIVERVADKRQQAGITGSNKYIVIGADKPYFKTVAEFVELMKKQYGGPNNANS